MEPEAKGAQIVQAAEGSFPERRAEQVKIERAGPDGEMGISSTSGFSQSVVHTASVSEPLWELISKAAS